MASDAALVTVGLHGVNNVVTHLVKADPGATVTQFAEVAQRAFDIPAEELVVYFNGREVDQSVPLGTAGVGTQWWGGCCMRCWYTSR